MLIKRILFVLLYVIIIKGYLAANGTGSSRSVYTRSGWVGARYVAMGMAAEVIADDVYAIYWNPAGLTQLKGKKHLTIDEISDKAKKGDVTAISEEDLIKFSRDKAEESSFQIGVSAAMLDVDRQAGFSGVAIDTSYGVWGIGLYSIVSTGIQTRDVAGNSTGETSYVASTVNVSYAMSFDVSSVGFTVKGLYEKIDDVTYGGAAADFGAHVFVLPFLKVGFMVQDIFGVVKPIGEYEDIENRYDFSYPTFRLGVLISSDTGIQIAITGLKKIELNDYGFNFGLQYDILKFLALYLGFNDQNFSTGLTIEVRNIKISYAVAIDKIDYGYNNIVSVELLF